MFAKIGIGKERWITTARIAVVVVTAKEVKISFNCGQFSTFLATEPGINEFLAWLKTSGKFLEIEGIFFAILHIVAVDFVKHFLTIWMSDGMAYGFSDHSDEFLVWVNANIEKIKGVPSNAFTNYHHSAL